MIALLVSLSVFGLVMGIIIADHKAKNKEFMKRQANEYLKQTRKFGYKKGK